MSKTLKDKICKVTNRSAGRVVYKIPENNVRREFQPGEIKQIPYIELAQLSMQPGGRAMMEEYLLIESEEVTEDLNVHTEPEYYLNQEQIIKLIKTGSLDAWLDMLEFAPEGVLDLVKELCVSVPLNDVQKRDALFKATGFSVDTAISNLEAEKREAGETNEKPVRRRRVQAEEQPTAPARRTSGQQYKVVSEEEK